MTVHTVKMGTRQGPTAPDLGELLPLLLREVAELRGDVRYLVSTQLKAQCADAALNSLVAAIHAALPPHRSFYSHEIIARAAKADDAGMALLAAITATGIKPKTRELGIYLGGAAKAGRYTTPEGVTLERSGPDSVGVLWSTQRV